MKDKYGNEIKIGDRVKTQQPPGGILPPAAPVVGIVRASVPWDLLSGLVLEYHDPPRYILLEGKINEVILT